MTKADAWKKRPIVLAYWEFKDEINKQANEQGFVLGEQYKMRVYVEMPKSWSEKKKQRMDGYKHQQRPDWDNYAKGAQDSLAEEDSRIWYAVILKRWAREPGIIIDNLPDDLDF
jgi:Holliday junction resolvase RusA-like endonuclease